MLFELSVFLPLSSRCSNLSLHIQAAADGSLGVLVDKVRSQPQIFTAYSKAAPIRDKHCSAALQAILLPLKVPKALLTR